MRSMLFTLATATAAVHAGSSAALLARCVPLRICGLGRYASAPAIFLEAEAGGPVLPVPVPAESVMSFEQALSMARPARMEVIPLAAALSRRDGTLFDNLPWQWNPSPQAKRDAAERCLGRNYPRAGYGSTFDLIVEAMRADACADATHVVLENAALVGSVVVGGAVLLERRGEVKSRAADAVDDAATACCECTADEAVGLALSLPLGATVHVERDLWEAYRLAPRYNEQRGKMRIEVMPRRAASGEAGGGGVEAPVGAAPLPWEIRSFDELSAMPLDQKALCALGAIGPPLGMCMCMFHFMRAGVRRRAAA